MSDDRRDPRTSEARTCPYCMDDRCPGASEGYCARAFRPVQRMNEAPKEQCVRFLTRDGKPFAQCELAAGHDGACAQRTTDPMVDKLTSASGPFICGCAYEERLREYEHPRTRIRVGDFVRIHNGGGRGRVVRGPGYMVMSDQGGLPQFSDATEVTSLSESRSEPRVQLRIEEDTDRVGLFWRVVGPLRGKKEEAEADLQSLTKSG